MLSVVQKQGLSFLDFSFFLICTKDCGFVEENVNDLPRLRPGFLTLGRPRPRLRQPQTTWQVLRKRRPGRARTGGKSTMSTCISHLSESDRCEIKSTRRLRTVLPVSLRTLRKLSAPTDPGTPLGTTRPGPGRESGTTRGVRLRRKSAYIARVAGRGVAGATATSICTADLTLLIL